MAYIQTQPLPSPPSKASNRLQSRLNAPRPEVGFEGPALATPRSSRSARSTTAFVTLAVWPTAFVGMVVWWCAVPWRPECPMLLFVAAISPLGYERCWWGYLLLGILIPCGLALVAVKTINAVARHYGHDPRHGKRRLGPRAIRLQPLSRRVDPPVSGEIRQRQGMFKNAPRKGFAIRRSSVGNAHELAQ